MHVTVGALLVRRGAEVLLVDHLAYGIHLQPGGHLEPTDATLIGAAVRELVEETGVDPQRSGSGLPGPGLRRVRKSSAATGEEWAGTPPSRLRVRIHDGAGRGGAGATVGG